MTRQVLVAGTWSAEKAAPLADASVLLEKDPDALVRFVVERLPVTG